jgi:flagellar basal body L-ring protein FlgH
MKMDLKYMPLVWMGLALILAICLTNPSLAAAHAPKEVKLEMDTGMQNLNVTITHKSPFPNWHYVKLVQITKNGSIVSTNEYKNQPDKETFEYTYPVAVTAGDVIEVTVSCSITGSKSAKLVINPPPKTP